MKQMSIIILLLWSGCLLPQSRAAAQEAASNLRDLKQTRPFELYRFTLANGLRVWCQPRPDSTSVVAFLSMHVGERNETPANNGISHYLEHLLFVGTARWNEDEIKDMIAKRGGWWNGWTRTEETDYFAEMAAADFDIAMDWLAEIVFRSTLPADKIEKERNVVFQEYWGKYGRLANALRRWLVDLGWGYGLERTIERAIYPHSNLTLDYLWANDALETMDRQALLDYYHAYYLPNNATLLIVGNVTPEQALAKAQTYFGNIPAGTRPPLPETPPLPEGGPYQITLRAPLPTNQCLLRIGARTVGAAHPDRWALDVLAKLLSTSLFKEIRNKRGLVYGVGAYNPQYSDVGRFEIGTRSEADKKELIQQIIAAQLDDIRQGKIDPAKFAEAQTALKGYWALNMESNFGRVDWLNNWTLALTQDETVPDYPAMIEAVAPADLTRVLKTYLVPQRSYVVMHVPILTIYRGIWLGGSVVVVLGGLIFYRRRRKQRQRQAAALQSNAQNEHSAGKDASLPTAGQK